MADSAQTNELYFAVLPMIHMGGNNPGLTEQILTLFPDRNLATLFPADEVNGYIATFKNRADKYLSGGHVAGYDLHPEPTEDGRILVRVTQNVR
jgi:hypothetical protein